MFFSIIVPIFNKQDYLDDCLTSLINQTLTSNEFEIICVDDGSTDNSKQIVKRYSEKHKNIILISKSNGGVSSARNAGLDSAVGQYIMFVDPDDIIATDALNSLKSFISQSNCSRMYFGFLSFKNKQTIDYYNENDSNISYNQWNIWSSAFKNSIVKENNIRFNESICYSEDTLFSLEFNFYSDSTVKYEKCLYFYRLNMQSATGNRNISKINNEVKSYIESLRIIKKWYENYSSEYKCDKSVICEYLVNLLRITIERIVYLPHSYRKQLINSLKKNKLYPFRIPKDFPVSPTDDLKYAYGKSALAKKIYVKSTTRSGYFGMLLYYFPNRFKQIVKDVLKR